eukprot:s4288_g5.t1
MSEMHKSKSKVKDKELESILDRAESGYAKDPTSGSTRSKSAALLALQQLLKKKPKLLHTAIENRLQEDWEQASMQPGIHQSVISARGWLEHRSRVQAFPSTIRAAWTLGAIWDCLRTGRIEEARARAALGVCALDQHACDSGNWLLATELTLETSYNKFLLPSASSSWRTPSHQVGRPSLIRSCDIKGEGPGRLPREKGQADTCFLTAQQECGGSKPKAKGEDESQGKGKRKGKALCASCGRECYQCQCGGVAGKTKATKHSVLGENAPVALLWPMSAPYNRWFLPGNVARDAEGESSTQRQKAVNLVVLALSWLHMRCPAHFPKEMSRHVQLSKKQWGVVRRLEEQLVDIELAGVGRTAAKMEGLDDFLHDLDLTAASLVKESYTARTVSARANSCRAAKSEQQLGEYGKIVGKMASKSTPALAKEIEASRLSFPKSLPEFNPSKLLDEPHRQVYEDPVSLAMHPDTVGDIPPTLQARASTSGALELLHVLDKHHRLRLATKNEVFLSDASAEKVASARSPLPLLLAREFQRHCLARGTWSRLLSPWRAWQRQREQLFEEDELPDGVPLVSHPLWLVLAQALQFRLNHCSRASGRKHINLLEMEAVLELERRLSLRQCDFRYLLGSDSQVVLAALVKGRSSSFHLNQMLRSILAVVLGSGVYGNYGYVPSLANVADDPTRDQEIRAPSRPLPDWWYAACEGNFEAFDSWLASLGVRATGDVDWKRQSFLDLYSGRAELIAGGAVSGIGAAPECGSFSRAVTPAVRDRDHPYGKCQLTANMAEKVRQGNSHAPFVLSLVLLCIELGLAYWVENPDGSFLWLLPGWLASGVASAERAIGSTCADITPPGESERG